MDSSLLFSTAASKLATVAEATPGLASPASQMRGTEFSDLMRSQFMQQGRQEFAGPALSQAGLQLVALGPQIDLITSDAPLPDMGSLAAFARAQGLDESAVATLFGGLVDAKAPTADKAIPTVYTAGELFGLNVPAPAVPAGDADTQATGFTASVNAIFISAAQTAGKPVVDAPLESKGNAMGNPVPSPLSVLPSVEARFGLGQPGAENQRVDPAQSSKPLPPGIAALPGTQVQSEAETDLGGLSSALQQTVANAFASAAASGPRLDNPVQSKIESAAGAVQQALAGAVASGVRLDIQESAKIGLAADLLLKAVANALAGTAASVESLDVPTQTKFAVSTGALQQALAAASGARFDDQTQTKVRAAAGVLQQAVATALASATGSGARFDDQAQTKLSAAADALQQAVATALASANGSGARFDDQTQTTLSATTAKSRPGDNPQAKSDAETSALTQALATQTVAAATLTGPTAGAQSKPEPAASPQAAAITGTKAPNPALLAPVLTSQAGRLAQSIKSQAKPPVQGAASARAEQPMQEAMRIRLELPSEELTRRLSLMAGTAQQAAWGALTTGVSPLAASSQNWTALQLDVSASLLADIEDRADAVSSELDPVASPDQPGSSTDNARSATAASSSGGANATPTQAALAEHRALQYQQLADRLGQAVAERLVSQIERGEWKMQMRLDPASLGRIDVQLDMHNGGLDATFMSDNQATRELIAQGAGRLKETLSQSGTTVASVYVNGDQGRQSGGNPTPGRAFQGRPEESQKTQTPTQPAAIEAARVVTSTGGLDLLA
jgi:flagellar hook-length control protein FliK